MITELVQNEVQSVLVQVVNLFIRCPFHQPGTYKVDSCQLLLVTMAVSVIGSFTRGSRPICYNTRTMLAYDALCGCKHPVVQMGHAALVSGIARLVGSKEQYKRMVT